ncbi:hypothetical protein NDU88_010598 [Pleurodeles waltl]|uniref:Uncharacterized protein n=1 Tax=Pleurodeles waltl TaxID=8319 RepID=A0AAV7PYU1_PLEWA|nr:hypothetical protein NDU88_010598 [Pleurodeles waltl]
MMPELLSRWRDEAERERWTGSGAGELDPEWSGGSKTVMEGVDSNHSNHGNHKCDHGCLLPAICCSRPVAPTPVPVLAARSPGPDPGPALIPGPRYSPDAASTGLSACWCQHRTPSCFLRVIAPHAPCFLAPPACYLLGANGRHAAMHSGCTGGWPSTEGYTGGCGRERGAREPAESTQ